MRPPFVFLALATTLVVSPLQAETAVRARAVSRAGEGSCQSPSWSAGGGALAFERVFIEERRIDLLVVRDIEQPSEEAVRPRVADERPTESFWKLGGKGEATPTTMRPGQVCRELAWGPSAAPDTYAYSCNAGTYQVFWSGGGQITSDTRFSAGQPAWNPGAWRLLYVSSAGGRGDIYMLDDLSNPNAPLKPRRLFGESARVNLSPVWSPLGDAVAFVSHGDDGSDAIHVARFGPGSEAREEPLGSGAGSATHPSWSPDGRRIAYFQAPRRTSAKSGVDRHDLMLKEVGAAAPPIVIARDVVVSEASGPAWSPDGRWLVYVAKNPKALDPLMVAEAKASGQRLPIKAGTDLNRDPTVAMRNGRWWLAFTAAGDSSSLDRTWRRVYVYPLDKLQRRSAPASTSTTAKPR